MNSNGRMAETRCPKRQSVQNLHRSFDRFDIVESDTTTDTRFQLCSDLMFGHRVSAVSIISFTNVILYSQFTCFHRYRFDAIFYGLRFAELLGSGAVIV